jgi:hypothetical protein
MLIFHNHAQIVISATSSQPWSCRISSTSMVTPALLLGLVSLSSEA